MYYYDGEDAAVLIRFMVDGESVTPTSATYSLRGHDGTVIGAADQDVVIPANATEVVIPIDKANNTLADGDTLQNRFVDVKFVYDGSTFRTREVYSIVPFAAFTANEARVRRLLGVFDHELPDEDIDLMRAFLDVKTALGGTVLMDGLSTTGMNHLHANDTIAFYAAMQVIPTLQTRVLQSTKDDSLSMSRLQKIDFEKLGASLASRYADAASALTGIAVTPPSLFITTFPTDAITGV